MWSTITKRRPAVDLHAERLELPDGDFVDLAWTLPAPTQTDAPIVVVLHGLEGSSDSPYARGIMAAIGARGWRGVLMHFRGCSGEPNRFQRAYHSGETRDVDTLVKVLRRRFPKAPLAAVGYSLGANVLLKWLGERGGDSPLRAAATVSPPFDLAAASDHLAQGNSRVYQRVFVQSLKRKYAAKQPIPAKLAAIQTIRQWDNVVTGPQHGFTDAADYYAQSSCAGFLGEVRTPTLVLHSRDDPFLPRWAIPTQSAVSSAITMELTNQGGHVGFVYGSQPTRPRYWLESRIPTFLARHLPAATEPHRVLLTG